MMDLLDKSSVNKLSDEELALAVQMIVTSSLWEELSLTRWEREFLPKMPEFYVRAGVFSWKPGQPSLPSSPTSPGWAFPLARSLVRAQSPRSPLEDLFNKLRVALEQKVESLVDEAIKKQAKAAEAKELAENVSKVVHTMGLYSASQLNLDSKPVQGTPIVKTNAESG